MGYFLLFVGWLAALESSGSSSTAPPYYQAELIFPPQAKHVHGSSLAALPNGDLIAVWFYGSGERTADDVLLQGARKVKGTETWSAPFVMADTPDLPDCNPVLFLDSRNRLWLFWVTIQNNQWSSALLKYRVTERYSEPGPPLWDWQDVIHVRPRQLYDRVRALLGPLKDFLQVLPNTALLQEVQELESKIDDPLVQRLGWMTRTIPIERKDGTILLGLYSDLFNCSLAALGREVGARWEFSEPILDSEVKYLGNVQPVFVEKKNGDIVAFMRDNGIPKYVRRAVSHDGGITWGRVELTSIRDSGASVACLALASGRWALVNNDLVSGRHRLSVHLSEDEGETWPWARSLEEAEPDKGGFSYPALIQTSDGNLHVTYSYHREGEGKSIKHVTFNEAWVLAAPREQP